MVKEAHTTRWNVLFIGFLMVVLTSLSIHVIMLQILNVPYPGNLPASGWARLPDRLLSVFGAATVYTMLPSATRARPLWQRVGLIFLLLAMIHESLIRVPFMNIAVASRWTGWPFLDAVPSYIVAAAVALAVVALSRFLTSPARRAVATLVIGVPIYMILVPALTAAYAGIAAWTSSREGQTLYNPPYDWHVELPAYVTFAEPVIAALAVAALVSRQLPQRRSHAWALLALVLFALRGQCFATFINIRYAGTDAVTAMLSFGQFALESLALATLTAATWVLASVPKTTISSETERTMESGAV